MLFFFVTSFDIYLIFMYHKSQKSEVDPNPFLKKLTYLFEGKGERQKETMHRQGKGRRNTEKERSQAASTLRVQPCAGLDLMTLRPSPEPKPRV